MENKEVWIVMDDCGQIVDIYDTEQKAKNKWSELEATTPRTAFYYEVVKREVH